LNDDLIVGRWGARFRGRRFPVSIGRGGFSDAKREGDGRTPRGAYALRTLFWRSDRVRAPVSILPRAAIGPRMGWSDDPADPEYNRLTRLGRGWSAERMRRGDPLYDIVVETSHNEAAEAGAGSAVFVHLWRGPGLRTAGCVGFRRRDLAWILARWRPWSRLVIAGASRGC
jgi:L,D-peptidoglycan transpeptidase YkuD (ErfK/YbiS/YcfS/YnhG family)